MKAMTGWLIYGAAALVLVACGGVNSGYAPGPTGSPNPPPAAVTGYLSIRAGGMHSCGWDGGNVYCWGDNTFGQLGDGTTTGRPMPAGFVPGLDDGIDGSWSASAGDRHTCALGVRLVTGKFKDVVFCWGDNSSGQLGDGTLANSTKPVPVASAANGDVVDDVYVNAGGSHSCGLSRATGLAYCWGDNSAGQLGDGTTMNSATPVTVVGGVSFSAPNATVSIPILMAGARHTCGLTPTGAAYCWGSNAHGQLGDGTTTDSSHPIAVGGSASFSNLSAGGGHTCGVAAEGVAYCWGSNSNGQLGNGTNTDSSLPVAVGGGLAFAEVSAGTGHTCGVTKAGAAYCWGSNATGQLGDGTTMSRLTPAPVINGVEFAAVSAGGQHSCGATTAGVGYCWGDNSFGKLGAGATNMSTVPVKVTGQP